MGSNFKILALIGLIPLLLVQASVAMTCHTAVSKRTAISKSLMSQDRTSDGIFQILQMEPSLKMVSTKISGQIVFQKEQSQFWRSFKDLHPGGQTPQGDLRWPIALLGFKTAEFLGFQLRELPDGTAELIAPNAQLFQRNIKKLNNRLKKLGFEPITYSTISKGFIGSLEMLESSMINVGDSVISFPYADKMKDLTPHEVSFHLGAIVFRRADNLRARAVNLRTLQLFKILKKDPEFSRLAEQLLNERANEMDVGTAGLPTIFGEIRINSGMANYNQLPPKLRENYIQERIIRSIGLYTKSKLTPVQAVIQRISFLTGVGRELLINETLNSSPQAEFNANTLRYGEFVQLSETARAKLQTILVEFERTHHTDQTLFPSDSFTQNFDNITNYMHQRIQEFEAAVNTKN